MFESILESSSIGEGQVDDLMMHPRTQTARTKLAKPAVRKKGANFITGGWTMAVQATK